jgi:hypothetical protein
LEDKDLSFRIILFLEIKLRRHSCVGQGYIFFHIHKETLQLVIRSLNHAGHKNIENGLEGINP